MTVILPHFNLILNSHKHLIFNLESIVNKAAFSGAVALYKDLIRNPDLIVLWLIEK